jgi:hypothetical protein
MKRSELKRKTPLRSRSLTQKQGKKCGKAKTQSWYRKHVIEQFMSKFRGLPCEICGKTENTCGHHVCSKQRTPAHIITPENIIVVCPSCHMFSNERSAHSSNALAVCRFMEWIRDNKPEQYEWCKAHENDSNKIDWRTLYVAQIRTV